MEHLSPIVLLLFAAVILSLGAFLAWVPFILACVAYHYTEKWSKNDIVPWCAAIITLIAGSWLNTLYFY